MATSTVPPLLSAFAFGIIVNAASAALLLHISGHGASIVRDGQRLVLATFLLGATVWALTAFIATAISTTATASCHIGIVFSTLFDQLARFSIEQYLLWAIHQGVKQSRAWQLIPQVLLLARFVLGAVFVGFSRPSFAPVCVPMSSTVPLVIVVVVVDAVFIAALVLRAFMAGVVADARNGQATSARSKSLLLVLVAFAIWTATSVTMLLGIKSTALLLKTLLPAIGLLILLTVVTIRSDALTAATNRPQAPGSPGVPTARDIGTGRSVATESTNASDYPPRRFEDLKRADLANATTSENARSIGRPVVPPLPSNYASQPTAAAGAGDNMVALALPRQTSKAKRGLFDRKASTKVSKISAPILQQNGSQNPLSKIPTISLEEAVRTERERRENAQEELHRDSALIAKRPAPPPPNMTPEEAMRRSISLKRKQIATPSSPPPMPSGAALENLQSTVTTSSAELSPGVDELRRRSPRQMSAENTTSRSLPAAPSPTLPLPASVRPPIRPSRQAPEENTLPREPPKSALQRRPTIGLPGNPRAKAIQILGKEAEVDRQQTVLFMNDIVYNSPETVQGIIDDANVKGNNRFSTQSVVHRPRPIPRQHEKDRAIFPAERSPGHRRNKSSNSTSGRKSILMQSTPGSPSNLPPLPPPPIDPLVIYKTNADRPLPNDTKSMTFDEKMALFFPAPSSAGSTSDMRAERRSSVPAVPPMPLDYMPLILSPIDGFDATTTRNSQSTARTGRTSVKTESILEAADLYRKNTRADRLDPMDLVQEAEHLRISTADDVANSWLPGIAFDSRMLSGTSPAPVTGGRKRASSPIIPPHRDSALTASTYLQTHDDITTNWGSLHSPVVAIPASREVARSLYINGAVQKSNSTAAPVADNDKDTNKGGEDVPPLPLLPATTYKEPESQWHRRVGDDCPTFSDRKEPVPLRKLPPPSPLRLQPASTKTPIIIKAAVPSPLESPERALAYIQAQLQRYEEPNEVHATDTPGQRMALLDDLEREMDAQAGHWKNMQQNLRHDSLSSIQTLSTVPGGSRHQSVRISRMQGKSARLAPTSFQTPLRNSMNDLGSPTPPDSDDSDVESELSRPRNIAEALSASLLDAVRDKNTLWTPPTKPLPKITTSLLWSPSAVSTAAFVAPVQLPSSAYAKRSQTILAPLKIESSSLWTKEPTLQQNFGSHGLWAAPLKQGDTTAFLTQEALSGAEQPQPLVMQAQGQTQWRLQELEREMTAMEENRPRASVQKAPRPVTQRPPRRSRRITALPDIVEDPQPLPDKRGTLGIFRFPWGERSDTVVLPPTRVVGGALMAMPGTMASGGGQLRAAQEARARQLEELEEAEAASATASFFEDYDDDNDTMGYEDEEEGDSEAYGSDSDDGFDENTLWEIASLLKTEQVPSTLSMFPPPFPIPGLSAVDDYMGDLPSDDDESTHRGVVVDYDGGEDITVDEIVIGYDAGAVDDSQEVPQESNSHGLWTLPQPREVNPTFMLFSKEAADAEAAARAVTRTTDQEPAALNLPRQLRTPGLAPLPTLTSSHLWTGPVIRAPVVHLWVAAPKPALVVRSAPRLFDPAEAAVERLQAPVRTTNKEPAALHMPRKRWTPSSSPLPQLTSTQLWTLPISGRSLQQLWVPRPQPINTSIMRVERHLFDREAAAMEKRMRPIRTTDKEPIALHMPRKVRVLSPAPLPKLTSTQLWTKPVKSSVSKLWVPRAKPTVVRVERHLFDRNAAAMEKMMAPVRTTDKEPAVLNMPRKVRDLGWAPLPKLESTQLWTAATRVQSSGPQLWVPAPKPMAAIPKGLLFDPAVAAMEKKMTATIRTTDKEPAVLNMPRKVRDLGLAPLPKLESTQLWTAAIRVQSRGPQLWVPVPKPATVLAKSLLFDTAVAAMEKQKTTVRTTDQEPAALHMPRKVRDLSWEPLAKLESTQLWTAKVRVQSRGPQLWVLAPKPAVVVAKSLLFDPAVAAMEKKQVPVRSTVQEPAALNMPRKLRSPIQAPLPKLTSTGLWTASIKASGAVQLWAPVPKPVLVRTMSHLFDPAVAAMEKNLGPVRTTSKEPVASDVPRKLRTVSRAPLPVLESSHLWSQAPRKQTGAVQLWTPAAPARPAKKTGPIRGLMGLFDKDTAVQAKQAVPTRTTEAEPIAAEAPVRGRRTLLPSLMLTTSTLWDKNSTNKRASDARPREWLQLSTKKEGGMWPAEDGSVGVQQEKRPVVSAEAWDAALQEALVRSYRPTAEDWDAALEEELARSYPLMKDWDAALEAALALSYPPSSPSSPSPSSPSTASDVSSPATPPAMQRVPGVGKQLMEDVMEPEVVRD